MAGPELSKRPRLSLQTKPSSGPSCKSTKSSSATVNPRSRTAFNTLSNVYVTAIERSTPVQSTPLTAINLHRPLRLQTDPESLRGLRQGAESPYTTTLPDTPLSANPTSPAQQTEIVFPSTMTATPPLSAGPVESSEPSKFPFAPTDTRKQALPSSPAQSRRRVIYAQFMSSAKAPYSRDSSLHSILRNSPLPPPAALSPNSPRRQSRRLQEKAERHVGYVSPLTQTITTEKYTRSHIDLLADDASPYTPSPIAEDSDMALGLATAHAGDETRDGGETPGPFEDMRRRMTGLGAETALHSPRPDGIRKRKRKEKKRKWVWTIGQDDEENESGAMMALQAAAETSVSGHSTTASSPSSVSLSSASPAEAATEEPITGIRSAEPFGSESDTTAGHMDIEMFDVGSRILSRATTPHSASLDAMETPTAPVCSAALEKVDGAGPAELTSSEAGERRDSPVPPDLVNHE